MDHAGNTAKDREDYIDPKMCAYSNLQKSRYGREKNRQDNFNYEHK
jgi:hypothetical protein